MSFLKKEIEWAKSKFFDAEILQMADFGAKFSFRLVQ